MLEEKFSSDTIYNMHVPCIRSRYTLVFHVSYKRLC